MDSTIKQQLLINAQLIGDQLLTAAKNDEYGTHWQTLSMGQDKQFDWAVGEGVYAGTTGIAMFLLELYKQTQEEKYLEAAENGMRWVKAYCKDAPTSYYALITGRLGVSWGMLRFYEHTKEQHYLDFALESAKQVEQFLDQENLYDDFINGISGTIQGLMLLHQATGADWILSAIDKFTHQLIKRAQEGPVGFYWDRSNKNIHGLCGFSHGAAGIGFVFLELGYYFNNPAYFWLAEQAFAYENHYFRPEWNNWPDFRKGIFSESDYQEHKKHYTEGNEAYFTSPSTMNAWCHGAAGIGLARARAYELLKNETYVEDLKKVVQRIESSDLEFESKDTWNLMMILCHGACGNADTLIEAYLLLQEEQYLELAVRVAKMSIKSHEQYQLYRSGYSDAGDKEDTSLFMGKAGIGYFYLRLLDPTNVPSILAPKLTAPWKGNSTEHALETVAMGLDQLKSLLIKNSYPRTFLNLEHYNPEALSAFLNQDIPTHASLKTKFQEFAASQINNLQPPAKTICQDAFHLEDTKLAMDSIVKSDSYTYIANQVNLENVGVVLQKDQASFLKQSLQIPPDSQLLATKWDWNLHEPSSWEHHWQTGEPENEEQLLLLIPSERGVQEITLSQFSGIMLEFFKEKRTIAEVLEEMQKVFETTTEEERQQVEQMSTHQVKALMEAGLLKVL